jgi:threonine/homoserine/homoserine lactone efflux protein
MLELMSSIAAPVAAGFGIGIALGGAPGPVQAVLLTESTRGLGRGFRAMAGANLTFGCLLVAAAAGLSGLEISLSWMRALDLAGGLVLLWLSFDGIRGSLGTQDGMSEKRVGLPPFFRGAAIVLLNPGGWLFLATVAASLFAAARLAGGRVIAIAAALAMLIGLALGDAAVVLFGGIGLRRARRAISDWIQRGLALLLAALGCWLVVMAVRPT